MNLKLSSSFDRDYEDFRTMSRWIVQIVAFHCVRDKNGVLLGACTLLIAMFIFLQRPVRGILISSSAVIGRNST